MSPETVALITSSVHWVGGALLAAAVLFFVIQFLAPGVRVGAQLKRARAKLIALRSKGPVLDLDLLRSEALSGEALHHCWDEFRDTLHGQKQVSAKGSLEVARWRATATANAFFTEQALVDSPLRTEFYKHLPGMLTGIGIIGTFSGLILGLQAFGQVDLGDAAQARLGLRALLGAVGGAFVVSGAAIALAMLLTAVEKVVINRLYTRLESLCGVIDSLFDSGAGEEYLQRLVDAAETSATQAIEMKESLVTDLKQVLTELTQQQIATMTATSSQLGQAITASLNDGLKEPLARISDAVQAVRDSTRSRDPGMNDRFVYDEKTSVLYAPDGQTLKQVHCPKAMHWNQLTVSDGEERWRGCTQCNERVVNPDVMDVGEAVSIMARLSTNVCVHGSSGSGRVIFLKDPDAIRPVADLKLDEQGRTVIQTARSATAIDRAVNLGYWPDVRLVTFDTKNLSTKVSVGQHVETPVASG